MPRVTYVKAAQQRYKTIPVLDAEGNPTYRETTRARPTKRGATVTRTKITVADKTQPLPPLRCDYAGCTTTDRQILPGQGYKWIKPKSGPYGGSQRNRHAEHPNWHQWEYSSSLSARVAQIQHDFTEALGEGWDDPDFVRETLSNTAESIRELAEEKREAATNIEDGFGHETSQSEELNGIADELETWADDVEGAEVPDLPDPEDAADEDKDDCPDCDGTGQDDPDAEEPTDCATCEGTGKVDPEEPTDAQMDEWRDEVENAISIVEESPV